MDLDLFKLMTQISRSQSISDVGLVRTNNEDCCLVNEEKQLFAVCDGLGGHAAGEIASGIAIRVLSEKIGRESAEPAHQLGEAILEANRQIIKDQQVHPDRVGMGTTLSALWVPDHKINYGWVGHVGDSRIYLLRDKKLQQLTEDHSPIYRLYKEGSLNKEELRHHPQKNLIERSLGLSSTVDSDLFSIELKKGDIFLLCTDGLSDHISDRDIETALQQVSWDDLASHLVQKALAAGGFDNITLVIVEIL